MTDTAVVFKPIVVGEYVCSNGVNLYAYDTGTGKWRRLDNSLENQILKPTNGKS